MSEALVAGLLAGYGVAIPVGAIGALLVGLTARTSLKVGVAAALGAATADGLYCLVAVLGGAAIAQLIEPIETPMRWAAAAVLLLMAVRTAVHALRRRNGAVDDGGLTTPWRAYFGLVGLTVLNPATVIYFGALVVGGQVPPDLGGGIVYVAAAFVASASWQLLLAGGGSLVGHVLTGPRGRLLTSLASSAVIAVLAVDLVV